MQLLKARALFRPSCLNTLTSSTKQNRTLIKYSSRMAFWSILSFISTSAFGTGAPKVSSWIRRRNRASAKQLLFYLLRFWSPAIPEWNGIFWLTKRLWCAVAASQRGSPPIRSLQAGPFCWWSGYMQISACERNIEEDAQTLEMAAKLQRAF